MRRRIKALIGGGIMAKKFSQTTINLAKLKGKLIEKGKNYKECADYIGIGEVQFCKKINGVVDFWVTEVAKLAKFLELSTEEFYVIFYNY